MLFEIPEGIKEGWALNEVLTICSGDLKMNELVLWIVKVILLSVSRPLSKIFSAIYFDTKTSHLSPYSLVVLYTFTR